MPLLSIVLAYFIGAIPFGYLIARARGVDILKLGSGNIGATNVGRVLGRPFGLLVFILDFSKGAVPVALLGQPGTASDPWADLGTVAVALATFLGHLFPIYLGFRGGKGVATGAGAVAVLLPGPTLVALLVWLAVFTASRTVSLASLVAVAALCGSRLMFAADPFTPANLPRTGFALLATLLVVARHHANLRRLLAGTENSFPESPTLHQLAKTLHVTAMGLWFGTSVFFTFVVGLSLFDTFGHLTSTTEARPWWLPVPNGVAVTPDVLQKQGSRIAGAAVGPIFPPYYAIQAGSAVLALGTALSWARRGGTHRIRAVVLAIALVGVGAGWWLERIVHEVGLDRNARMDQVVTGKANESEQAEAQRASASFGMWHGISLLENFLVLGLAGTGMVLAARLPEGPLVPTENTHGTVASNDAVSPSGS